MLTRVTGRVDCFGCVCVPYRLKDKVFCVLQYMCTYVYVLYCVLVYWYFHAVVRRISVLFIDEKDDAFCVSRTDYWVCLHHFRF